MGHGTRVGNRGKTPVDDAGSSLNDVREKKLGAKPKEQKKMEDEKEA